METQSSKNLQDAAKALLRVKFIAIFETKEKSQINNLTFHPKELEKEEQKSPKSAKEGYMLGHSFMSDSLWPHVIQPSKLLLCPWNFPGKDTSEGCQLLLQGILLTQGSNPHLLCLLHWQADSLSLAPPGKSEEGYTRVEICRDKKKRKKREKKRSVKARPGFFEKTNKVDKPQSGSSRKKSTNEQGKK